MALQIVMGHLVILVCCKAKKGRGLSPSGSCCKMVMVISLGTHLSLILEDL